MSVITCKHQRRRLPLSPVESNDCPKLELSGAWELTCTEHALSFGEGKVPNVLFLMETKQTVEEMRWIQGELHYDSMLAVPCLKRRGGLAVLWKNEVDLHI